MKSALNALAALRTVTIKKVGSRAVAKPYSAERLLARNQVIAGAHRLSPNLSIEVRFFLTSVLTSVGGIEMLFKNGSGTPLQLRGAILKWALCSALFFAFSLGQASATDSSDAFLGWPSEPFVQQNKTWGGWADVGENLPSDFTTLVSTRSGIVLGQDLHTFSLSASFPPNTTYLISYYIMVNTPGVSMMESSDGLRTTIPGASISTTFAEIPAFTISTPDASGLQVLSGGPYSMLHVTDTVTTGDSDITGFSNSFLEQLAVVPEPGTLALFGSGILAGAAMLRRKVKK